MNIPDEVCAQIYQLLRAGKSTKEALAEIAEAGGPRIPWSTARRELLQRGYDLDFVSARRGGGAMAFVKGRAEAGSPITSGSKAELARQLLRQAQRLGADVEVTITFTLKASALHDDGP